MKKIILYILIISLFSTNANAFLFLLMALGKHKQESKSFKQKAKIEYLREDDKNHFISFGNITYSVSKEPISYEEFKNSKCIAPNFIDIINFYRYTVSWEVTDSGSVNIAEGGMYGSFWIEDKYLDVQVKEGSNSVFNGLLFNAIGIAKISKHTQYNYLDNYEKRHTLFTGFFDTKYFYYDSKNNNFKNKYGIEYIDYSFMGKNKKIKNINQQKGYLVCKKEVEF